MEIVIVTIVVIAIAYGISFYLKNKQEIQNEVLKATKMGQHIYVGILIRIHTYNMVCPIQSNSKSVS